MFQSLSAEIDRVKKENDNMQIELRPVFAAHFPFYISFSETKFRFHFKTRAFQIPVFVYMTVAPRALLFCRHLKGEDINSLQPRELIAIEEALQNGQTNLREKQAIIRWLRSFISFLGADLFFLLMLN
jgi:hypothetical protein